MHMLYDMNLASSKETVSSPAFCRIPRHIFPALVVSIAGHKTNKANGINDPCLQGHFGCSVLPLEYSCMLPFISVLAGRIDRARQDQFGLSLSLTASGARACGRVEPRPVHAYWIGTRPFVGPGLMAEALWKAERRVWPKRPVPRRFPAVTVHPKPNAILAISKSLVYDHSLLSSTTMFRATSKSNRVNCLTACQACCHDGSPVNIEQAAPPPEWLSNAGSGPWTLLNVSPPL